MANFKQNKLPCNHPSMISLTFLLLFLLQSLFTMQVNSYDPAENFAVNCGNSGNIIFESRTWVGDVDSKLFSPIEPQTGQPSVIRDAPQSSISLNVPFGTARLSHSEFTYSFPLSTDGPKFLRLHFYPTSYANFEPYNSLFSVKAGPFTLLKDFNASLASVNGENTFFREYCINVETVQRLNVTFLPSTNRSDAYAFINGIEVVSMPLFLYYSNPNDPGFELVGHGIEPQYKVDNNKALETLYRIKVNGRQIPPSADTGMFRNWDGDIGYLENETAQSASRGSRLKLNYKGFPNYFAPADVYLSARSCGKYVTENCNVTWDFEVDSEFTYMVRLHFCEFDVHIQKEGDRVFQIFIADNLAEENADVIEWSGGNLVPVHEDYAVLMSGQGSSKKVNLSIRLQPLPKDMSTRYHDVTLNGIEIFKISDEKNNLAGPNPDPLPSPPQVLQPLTQSSKNSKKTTTAIIAAGAVSGLVLVSVVGFIISWRRSRGDENSRRKNASTAASKSRKTQGSSLPSDLCRYFSISEIRAATNNFDDVFIVGVGGFGNVYKGYIDDGSTPVAIKRLKPGSQQGAREFMNEIEMLSQLRHLHLVSLIGYCDDGNEMILVYDFMQRGTFREYLYGSGNQPLPWKQRLQILLGAARGLHYLHAGAKHNIIHRDVKSTNILLDEKWAAKVSDFGLSKVGPTGMSRTHVSTVVKGSLGYLDPEYYKRQRLTLKSDVYSFGVVLLEALCGRPPLVRTVEKQEASLVEWVRRCHDQGEVDQTVDAFLKGTITPECLKSYCQLALSCLLDDGNQRPSMSHVVGVLEFALQLVESEEDGTFGGGMEEGKSEQRPLITQLMSEGESGVRFTSSDESGSKSSKVTTTSGEDQAFLSAVVFSEIVDPRAR